MEDSEQSRVETEDSGRNPDTETNEAEDDIDGMDPLGLADIHMEEVPELDDNEVIHQDFNGEENEMIDENEMIEYLNREIQPNETITSGEEDEILDSRNGESQQSTIDEISQSLEASKSSENNLEITDIDEVAVEIEANEENNETPDPEVDENLEAEENREAEDFLNTQAKLKTEEDTDDFDVIEALVRNEERCASIERTESFENAKKETVRQIMRTAPPKRWHGQIDYDPSTLSFASTEIVTVSAERVALEHINTPQVIIQAQETTKDIEEQPSAEFGVIMRMSGNFEDLIHNVSDDESKKVGFDLSPQHSLNENSKQKYPDIDFIEIMQHFKNSNVQEKHKKKVHNLTRLTGWKAIKRRFFMPKLHRDLLPEQEFLLCIAQCPFEENSMSHHRVIQTIYRRLTQTEFECPRFGPHWECIGFQGADPSTDLRSTGMLSLVMLIYMLTSSQLTKLTRNIYLLSIEWEQNFPFCLMSINMTRIVMQALKDGLLNKICNQNGSVVNVCHSLYVAAYLYMYDLWKDGDKTIIDSGPVLKEVEKFIRKTPKVALRNLGDYMEGPQTVEETKVGVEAFVGVMELAAKVAG